MKVPLMKPLLPSTDALIPYLRKIDENRIYSNFGPLNSELQSRLEKWYRVKFKDQVFAVTASSATTALELLIQSLNIEKGSKVLLPALTFVATATAIRRLGFVPVACDVDVQSWLMTPETIKGVSLDDVSAVIPVAPFGIPQDTDEWTEWSLREGIPVVFDSAAAFGGQRISSQISAAFSLHATKALGSAEGGFVLTTDGGKAEYFRRLTNFGLPSISSATGTNGKMSEYHAAIALAALDQWEVTTRIRIGLRNAYSIRLAEVFGSEILCKNLDQAYCPSVYIVRLRSANHREFVERKLWQQGIETRRWYSPLVCSHHALSGVEVHSNLKNAQQVSDRLLGLPFYVDLSEDDVDQVVKRLRDAWYLE